jgi:hypothetical protein
MSSNIADERRHLRVQTPRKYRNPIGAIAYTAIVALCLLLGPIFGLVFGVVRYWGWGFTFVLISLMIIVGAAIFSLGFFTSVVIGGESVILRAPFRRLCINRHEVSGVELNPGVHTLKLDWSFSDIPSKLTIHTTRMQTLTFSMMPDGLKRRIAQALDPAHWPPLPEPQQE